MRETPVALLPLALQHQVLVTTELEQLAVSAIKMQQQIKLTYSTWSTRERLQMQTPLSNNR